MHRLGLLTDWQYRVVFIELSERGQRRSEQDGIARETSLALQKVLASLRREDGLSKSDIADQLAVPLDELNKVVFGLVLTQVITQEPEDDESFSRANATTRLQVLPESFTQRRKP
jgi:hypothetical protein